MARTEAAGRLHRRGHIDPHRAPQEQSLLPKQPVDGVEGILVADANGIIDRGSFQVGGHAAVADPLGDRAALGVEFAAAGPAVQGAAVGIGQHAAHPRVPLLEVQGHSGIGAAGAGGRHPGIHLPAALLPDLRTGARVMGAAVGEVVELVGPNGTGNLGGDAAGEPHVVVRVGVRHGRHGAHLRPEAAQQADLLGRLGVGDHDQAAVTAGIAEMGQADAGVAGGALHHSAAGPQLPASLRLLQDAEGGAVFHRTAGIHEFGLAEDVAAGELTEGPQADQGGVAHGGAEALTDAGRDAAV